MTSAPARNRGPIVCVLPDGLFTHHKEGLAKLVGRGTKVVREQSASTALDSVEALGPSLLIVALSDPEMGGLVFIAKLYKRYPSIATPAVVLPDPGDSIEPLICIPDPKTQHYDVEHYLGDSLWNRIAELAGVGERPGASPPDASAPGGPAVAPLKKPVAPPPASPAPEDAEKTPPGQFPAASLAEPPAPPPGAARPAMTYRWIAPARRPTPFVQITPPPEAIAPIGRDPRSLRGGPAPAASVVRPGRAAPLDPTPPVAPPEIEPPTDPSPPAAENLPAPPAPGVAPVESAPPPAPEPAHVEPPEWISPLDTGGGAVAGIPAAGQAPVRASRSRSLFVVVAIAAAALAFAFAFAVMRTGRAPVEVSSRRGTAPLPVSARPVPPPALAPSAPNVSPPVAAPVAAPAPLPTAAKRGDGGLDPGRHLVPVTFKQNKDEPTVANERALGELLDRLRRSVGCTATVVGHASDEGEYNFNTQLGGKRAQAVAKLLRQRGVTRKLGTRSAGATEPAVPATTEEGRRANRRAELEIRCP